eukprot:CAMPEP_0117008940 /NCGR_PEP_ID=MMETSP0472-20121206/8267_1 /TAXON_ID=693140 ORGANISM="Tiarina fusus, Strain LIS" /NCGR_SAMPLE_ID=MMETSP0472 /ASSEMBLY_ACC=CAM_ASM_000603 /LENGTH=240 /DNA_ID=CAMNT_0004711105 /DNA_START=24 /DNA_END=743 /DNA_ORIENTATION=+
MTTPSSPSQPPSNLPRIYRVPLEQDGSDYFAIVIRNVFTPEECEGLIERSNEEVGYEPALLNVGRGRQVLDTAARKSDRCILDDPNLAEDIWRRICTALDDLSGRQRDRLRLDILESQTTRQSVYPVGLNERLRFLRYNPGDYFRVHADGCYVRSGEAGADRRGERSLITCQVYLNEGFSGGATTLYSSVSGKGYDVVPETGSVLLFEHGLYHQGSQLLEGVKYAIRTDVMYTFKGEPGW